MKISKETVRSLQKYQNIHHIEWDYRHFGFENSIHENAVKVHTTIFHSAKHSPGLYYDQSRKLLLRFGGDRERFADSFQNWFGNQNKEYTGSTGADFFSFNQNKWKDLLPMNGKEVYVDTKTHAAF